MHYLALDTETGGLVKGSSLLTAWFGIYDDRFELKAELDLKIKPEDGEYRVTAQALDINKIDLIKHDAEALTYKEGASKLYHWLYDNKVALGVEGSYVPVGHNGHFDVAKVTEFLLSKGSWDNFVSYRMVDTAVVARFLEVAGILHVEGGLSLGNLIKHFKIEVEGNHHEARYDGIATMELLDRMMYLNKNYYR